MRRCLNCMSEYPEQYEDRCPHCGYVHNVTQSGDVSLPPGSILQGRYIVGTVIKARDTDVFYNGWDALFDRRVQIQEYFPRYCATRSGKEELSIYDSKVEKYAEGLELFFHQSRELIRLYKEEDVITYHACFRENKTAYAVMEYRNLSTLKDQLDGKAVSTRQALKLLREAICTVGKYHEIGVYHGMLALDTFWVAEEGKLIVKDFGAWRYVSGEPGIVSYGKGGVETDVYGLARLFCQIVTGRMVEGDEKLLAELTRSRIRLNQSEAKALRNALAHDTRSLQRFQEELEGSRARPVSSVLAKQAKRRDARYSLTLPKWCIAAAGVGVALILGFTVFHVRGIRLKSDASVLEQQQVRVPNVINKNVDAAEAELKELGLVMQREQMEYSEEILEDMIIYQTPKEGTALEKGEAVMVSISKGKQKAELPLVNGMEKEAALKALEEAGFHTVTVVEDPESTQEYGTVLGVAVKTEENEKPKKVRNIMELLLGGTSGAAAFDRLNEEAVALSAEIELIVSTKELPSEELEVEVPKLVGLDVTKAGELLQQIEGKPMELTFREEYSDRPAGEILSQDPEAGAKTKKSYVTVVVSRGKKMIRVESVELMTLQEAKEKLRELELVVGTVTEAYHDSVAAGKVIAQSTGKDETVEKGTAVDLVISLGRKPQSSNSNNKTAETKAAPTTAAPTTAAVTTAEPTTEAPTEEVPTAEPAVSDDSGRESIVIAPNPKRSEEEEEQSQASGPDGSSGNGGSGIELTGPPGASSS